jgi:hypothetical protein
MLVKILVVLAAIILNVLVVALFTKNRYTLKREVDIDRPTAEVFDYIKLNKNQKYYSKWLSLDPNTKIEFKGAADGTPGAIFAFQSKNEKAGTGEWEIKKVTEGEGIDFELRFLAPYVFTASGSMSVQALSPAKTRLTWIYHGGMDWPKNVMLLFLNMDKIIGPDIEESLGNIKRNLERGSGQ